MSDYIKRDDAIKLACSDCEPYSCDKNCTLIQILKMTPAADVVERKHGKWERKLVPVCDDGIIMVPGNVCSECGGITTYNVSLFKYCPGCGAQMESGDSDV